MREMQVLLLVLGVGAGSVIMRGNIAIGGVPPLAASAAVIGFIGLCLLFTEVCARVYARIDRRLNLPPKPPYFVIDKVYGPCLEVDADGSYESCQRFLSTLGAEFDAVYSNHLDAGPRPYADKDKGYWNVKVFGQDFFVMRDRNFGTLCIGGPKLPADPTGFLRIAAHFNAIEFLTWQQKLARFLHPRSSDVALTQAR